MIKNIESRNDSIKINDKEIAILKEHFPTCFRKDGSFDIAKLRDNSKTKLILFMKDMNLNFLEKVTPNFLPFYLKSMKALRILTLKI